MVKEKSNRTYIIILMCLHMIACTNMYENKISDILCMPNVSVISSKRYESRGVGEWYILERYILSTDTAIQLEINKDSVECSIERHPFLKDYYWIGWNPIFKRTGMYDILAESSCYFSKNVLVREYNECCNGNTGYFTILIRDSLGLYNALQEKTAVVYNTRANTIYICNYHY